MSANAMGIGFAAVLGAGILASAGLILALRPWLVRYALARPSARGLHVVPTPQGGGIAVLLACLLVVVAGGWLAGVGRDETVRLASVLAAALGLAVVGFVDDIRPLPAWPRLVVQMALMAVGVAALPEGARVLPFVPIGLERAVLVVGGAWFINLTNFMDGMDWMTVTAIGPLVAALVLFWGDGHLSVVPGLLALGLLGGLLGYAPFNKPVARLFLGDVGSLPIGFLVAYCLFGLAGAGGETSPGGLVPAILLPLYYIADSGLTLLWRLRRGEPIWQPHRSHFYQVAVLRGATVGQVLRRVFVTNLVLALLAWTALGQGPGLAIIDLGLGAVAVGCLLVALSRQTGGGA